MNDIVTREEVAVMVAKAVGLKGSTPVDTKFPDVKNTNKNSGYIQAPVNAGIINGYVDGTFKPNAKVTRGHMAAFIARGFKLTEQANINFKDVAKGSTAYEAVRKLAHKGITTGYTDGSFKPNANLSRAHISAFISRAMGFQKTLAPEEKAINAVMNSSEFDGEISELYVNKLNEGIYEIKWSIDYGSGLLTLINSWVISEGKIVDQLWKNDMFNESYWKTPYFGISIPEENKKVPDYVFTEDLILVAQDGTYIGKLTTNKFDSESIFNEYGTYGSKFASKSIWNEFGTYGSKFNKYSPFNEFSTTPPAILHGEDIVGYLSLNLNNTGAISPLILYSLLLDLGM